MLWRLWSVPLLAAFVVPPVHAQAAPQRPPAVTGVVLAGAAAVPRFPGASDRRAIPFVAGRVQFGRRYVGIEGTGLRVNLLTLPWLEAGPAASLTFGREAADAPGFAAVDDAIEIGGFLAASTRGMLSRTDQLRLTVQATRDVSDAHDGWVGTAALGYAVSLGRRWRPSVELLAGGGNAAYQRAYFASGTFVPGSGVQYVGASLGTTVALGGRWLATGFGGVRRLVGDAADSPVTTTLDGRTQWLFGGGVGLTF